MHSYSLKHLLLLLTVAALTCVGLRSPSAVAAAIATSFVFVVLAWTVLRTSWRSQTRRTGRAFAVGVWMYFLIAFGPMSYDFKIMMPTTLALDCAYSQMFQHLMSESDDWQIPPVTDERRARFMHIGHCCATVLSGLVLAALPACMPDLRSRQPNDSR